MEEKLVSRRGFIMGAAAAATGAALLGSPIALAADGDPLPDVGKWPYAALDADAIGTLAKGPAGCGGCGGKSAGAIILGLREALPGGPWDQLPVNIGSFANGGGPYGATCGGAAGPFFIMQLIGKNVSLDPTAPKWTSAATDLGTAFHKWYCDAAFPSTEWDALFPGFAGTVQSVSGSPLCHESRAIWENAYLRQWDRVSTYDGTRCTKLPMDTAKKAVQMLNDWYANPAAVAWAPDADYATCYTCHTQLNTDHKVGAIHSSGKENCNNCHTVTAKHAKSGPGTKPSRKPTTLR
jgi:hypothetical protein